MNVRILLATAALLLAACAGGAFQAFEGTLTPDQVATLNGSQADRGKVVIVSVNGKQAGGTQQALLQGGAEAKVVVRYAGEAGSLEKELVFTPEGGKVYTAQALAEDRNLVPGSAKVTRMATLWIASDATTVAGSDSSDNLEAVK